MQIWWIRRDLRLEDNPALTSALQSGSGVLPVFILDEYLLSKPAKKRQEFLFAGLHALETNLRHLGSGLVVRTGKPAVELPRLAAECGAGVVFAEEDISPYALRRDAAVARQVDLRLVHGLGVHPPAAVTRANGDAYTVFTPYSRTWKALPLSEHFLPPPTALPPIPNLPTDILPDPRVPADFSPGELEAQRRLAVFLAGPIFTYQDGRNRMDLDGTSTLSPYLRFGMLSARRAAAAALQAARSAPDAQSRAGCETWLNELIWREFYQSILYHFPYVLSTAFNGAMRSIPWRNAPEDLQAWQDGRTGFPVVDAAMRQLAATGWIHNRARMITASFLVKDLLINWQAGEHWFLRMLIDGDPAANNGGWQWTAGTGTDAAPYFRIFNPILQGKKFDPSGEYVRHWLPELAGVHQNFIHSPWEMSAAEQSACGVIIGDNYPAPIVEHTAARERVLAAYAVKRG
jgi:deoxyribodipyrimidine photo-lyase